MPDDICTPLSHDRMVDHFESAAECLVMAGGRPIDAAAALFAAGSRIMSRVSATERPCVTATLAPSRERRAG